MYTLKDDSTTKKFLAFDFGATSGRSILGTLENDKITIRELTRFPNPIIEINGRSYWDLFFLYNEMIKALKFAKNQHLDIASIGIDTWGVDFVCLGKDGEPLRMPYSYRDTHTPGASEEYFRKISREEIYKITGIQVMDFNSVYQLFAMKENNNSIYNLIDKIAFMPDVFAYLLTGKLVTEYTIASTSQLLNAFQKDFDESLLASLNLNKKQFGEMVLPGKSLGKLSDSVQKQTGPQNVQVIAVAGHDTASAVVSVPSINKNFAYLSSGTWSLMGIEVPSPVINEKTYKLNFTNEGGADGSIRLLKNICGMWLLERCRKEWENDTQNSHSDLIKLSLESEAFRSFINPDDQVFANPDSMVASIQKFCKETSQPIPRSKGEIVRCIFESLAFRYKQVFQSLQDLSTHPIEVLHVIGGGSQNDLLNTYTANALGITVVAGPSEATALGNILIQAKAAGMVSNMEDIRKIVRNSVELKTFEPQEQPIWQAKYNDYLKIVE